MRRAWLIVLMLPLVVFAADEILDLNRVREVNLEHAAKLPNFVADETAMRYKSRHTVPPRWELFDKIEAEIVVQGSSFRRQNVRRNGKPWKKPDFSDFNWGLQFGYELKPLFDPKCPTAIEFEGREEARGKQLLAYRYHAPPDGCCPPCRRSSEKSKGWAQKAVVPAALLCRPPRHRYRRRLSSRLSDAIDPFLQCAHLR